MIDIEAGVKWAERIAADDTHGYSQPNRMSGIDYDCSSLVGAAITHMGFTDYPSDWYPSTREMGAYLEDIGWKWHEGVNGLRRGDILWKSGHTALAVSSTKQVEACIAENGTIHGTYGDQTGNEIRISNVSIYAWKGYWFYPEEEMITDEDVKAIADAVSNAVWNFDQNGTLCRDRLQGADQAACAARDELQRTDDPSGRDIHMKTHDHIKWLAAKQNEMDEKLNKIVAMLEDM